MAKKKKVIGHRPYSHKSTCIATATDLDLKKLKKKTDKFADILDSFDDKVCPPSMIIEKLEQYYEPRELAFLIANYIAQDITGEALKENLPIGK